MIGEDIRMSNEKPMTRESLICGSFGKLVHHTRISKNMSQVELVEISGVSQSNLSKIEKGKRDPSLSIVIKLCDALELDINEFAKPFLNKKKP
jgi:transcriptional regulator with XRE-family HTH domain